MTPVPSGLQLLPEFFRTAHTKPIPSLAPFDVRTRNIYFSWQQTRNNSMMTGVS
jgi:hypothetical protein